MSEPVNRELVLQIVRLADRLLNSLIADLRRQFAKERGRGFSKKLLLYKRLSHLRKPSCEGRYTPIQEAKVTLSSSSPRFTRELGFFWGADEAPTAKGSAERSL